MRSASVEEDVALHLARLREAVERAVDAIDLPAEPSSLYDPVRYVLDGGGKRFRPVLLLLAAQAYGLQSDEAMPAALAVEVFHNFTLVHDDIMDHSATRRGRDTVHLKWDPSTAILSGDYMMAMSYRLLAEASGGRFDRVFPVFDEMVRDLCEGQAMDKEYERRAHISLASYEGMIDAKTGALLRASLELGAQLAGAGNVQTRKLRQVGIHLGRAFQIQDDLLDLVATDERWGKRVGGDLVEAKKTFLLVRALEHARGEDREWFAQIVSEGGLAEHRIDEARARLERIGVLDEARQAVERHTKAALSLLSSLEAQEGPRAALERLVGAMKARLH